jgi:hypothetical protein
VRGWSLSFDEALLCANQLLRWQHFWRLAACRLPPMRSLTSVVAGVDTLGADTLAAATLVVTSPTSAEVPVATFGDMVAVSGMAVGGVMALARAGRGRMFTASMRGPVNEESARVTAMVIVRLGCPSTDIPAVYFLKRRLQGCLSE